MSTTWYDETMTWLGETAETVVEIGKEVLTVVVSLVLAPIVLVILSSFLPFDLFILLLLYGAFCEER